MSYFTFKNTGKNKPIAQIIGGERHGKIIFIDEEDEKEKNKKCCDKCHEGCGFTTLPCCKMCGGTCFDNESSSDDEEYAKILGGDIKKLAKGQLPYIELNGEEKMIPIPLIHKEDEEARDNVYNFGPEGSGKSSWTAKFIKQYKAMYPKSKFYLFSGLDSDKVLDDLNPIRIKIDKKLVDKPMEISDFPINSIVVFDDIDTISDKNIKKEVLKIRDKLLEKGRHRSISVISITHNPTTGNDTKLSLLESNSIVLYPRGGDTYHMDTVLKKYLGYDKKAIDKIKKLKSRWAQCHKRYPKFVLHELGCFLI